MQILYHTYCMLIHTYILIVEAKHTIAHVAAQASPWMEIPRGTAGQMGEDYSTRLLYMRLNEPQVASKTKTKNHGLPASCTTIYGLKLGSPNFSNLSLTVALCTVKRIISK